MARKAHSRITRTHVRWAAEVADNSVIQVMRWDSTSLPRAEIFYYGVETGWRTDSVIVMDETAVALAVSLISGKDVAGILADRVEELGYDSFASYLRRGNAVEVAEAKKSAARIKAKLNRMRAKDAMESLGMKKVRGAMGGTYWE
jgi:hypothetical protein